MTDEIRAALDPVADALNDLRVPFRIGGSVASSILGVARSTLDVDLVADLREAHVVPLVRRLLPDYYADEEMIRDAIRRQDSFNLIHLATMLKIDVFVLKRRPFDLQAFSRVTYERLGEGPDARELPLTTAEDIVIHKLDWFRLGGGASKRQWEDVLGVLKLQAESLDRAYMEHWARELDLDQMLSRAFAEAGLVSR
jgi:hypothetical protein